MFDAEEFKVLDSVISRCFDNCTFFPQVKYTLLILVNIHLHCVNQRSKGWSMTSLTENKRYFLNCTGFWYSITIHYLFSLYTLAV